jgi:carboxypeptidase Q
MTRHTVYLRRSILTPRILALAVALTPLATPVSSQVSAVAGYEAEARRLIEAASSDRTGWERLAYMVDTFGPRISGSVDLENALDWILAQMAADGLNGVQGQPVMVPNWVRGEESLEMIQPRPRSLPMLALGGSVGTPPEGIRGEVIVVGSFEELEARAAEARGRIVLFDVPFTVYGETVMYRRDGASAAARAGAIASLLRSVGPFGIQSPHTGSMRYDEGVTRIPHAAVTGEDASMMRRMHERGQRIEVHLRMEARTMPDAPSRNVMAEVRGSEYPHEVVVLGGHIDSWDVGQGAMDDGGGSVAAWEAVRLMKALGLRPRRTVRVVLWTAEENGQSGGRAYRDSLGTAVDDHVLAMESDGGVFKPLGFGFTGSDEAYDIVREVGRLLGPIEAGEITRGGGGADIRPLMDEGVPGMGLRVEPTEYFWYHHTDGDTLDKLDPDEFAQCVAAMAVMAYVVADLPERLPR